MNKLDCSSRAKRGLETRAQIQAPQPNENCVRFAAVEGRGDSVYNEGKIEGELKKMMKNSNSFM